MNYLNKLFRPFPMTNTLLMNLYAFVWRIRGCNHDTEMYLDLGDEEHTYWYCFRCCTKT